MIDYKFSEEFLNKRLIKVKRYEAENYESCHIIEYGYFPHAKYHFFKRESGADEHILILCSRGEGTVEIQKKTYKITPKMYFLIPKNVSHTYYANNQNPWSIYWFHFKDDLVNLPFVDTLSAIKFNALIAVFQYMIQIIPKTNTDIIYLNAVYGYISDTIKYQIGTTIKNSHVELAIHYMSENISNQISLLDIANYSGVSTSQLSLLFKKHFGIPPFSYYLGMKVEEASNMLLSTNLTVKEVCVSLGFEDQFYFSRLFKRHVGVSPRAFKTSNTAVALK
jgi:AraC family transcriptional regulator, arabinose operon regulatory protein